MKINKGTGEYVKEQYADYNRYADPHLRNYLVRKQMIASKGKDNLTRGLYYANKESSTKIPAQINRSVNATRLGSGKSNYNKYANTKSRYL